MKTFRVLITGYRTVLVEADTPQEAEEIASEECSSFQWEIDSWKCEEELSTPERIAQAKKHGAVELDDF